MPQQWEYLFVTCQWATPRYINDNELRLAQLGAASWLERPEALVEIARRR